MDKNDKDKLEGFGDEAKGKAKQVAGDLRGDDDQKAEGKADELMGKVKKGVADVKDRVKDAADDLKK
ncbi:MAG TPA: CsbD family protein [Thermomicrobiales bacterium]|nr:CsbD family protein [Thermomicrobiales bacterium]